MVAKAGYALHRNLIPADKILMLAFNNAAAKELGARTQERLAPLGLDAGKVVAKTIHAVGLEIIGKATGRKPSLARWLKVGETSNSWGASSMFSARPTRRFVSTGTSSGQCSPVTTPTLTQSPVKRTSHRPSARRRASRSGAPVSG